MGNSVTELPSNALYAAIAKAQGEFATIAKNRTVKITTREKGSYEFRYADLEAVIAATRPALAKHGLAVVQIIDGPNLVTTLLHESGESLSCTLPVVAPQQGMDLKAYGATLSYLRRYAYSSLLCLAADDDADESDTDAPLPPATYAEADFINNFPRWEALIATGKCTGDEVIERAEAKAPLTAAQKQKIKAVKVDKKP